MKIQNFFRWIEFVKLIFAVHFLQNKRKNFLNQIESLTALHDKPINNILIKQ